MDEYGIRTELPCTMRYAWNVANYGQFCSIARALDVLGERWTLLIVREVMSGSTNFGDIRRGIPRISRTMTSVRLTALCESGILRKNVEAPTPTYELTRSGKELVPIVGAIGAWGQRWLTRDVDEEELDMDALLWDVRRRVRRGALPAHPVLLRIEFSDLPANANRRYLLLRNTEVSLCSVNPGYPEELFLLSERRALVSWWRGDEPLSALRKSGALRLSGKRSLVRAFPTWFDRYLLADVPPAQSKA